MGLKRQCSKTGCARAAVATLTYAYAESSIVIGPLATYAEPHTYDMCTEHADRLTPPRGWQVVRLGGEYREAARHTGDDLSALADALREDRPRRAAPDQNRPGMPSTPAGPAAGPAGPAGPAKPGGPGTPGAPLAGSHPGESRPRRPRHLRVLPEP